MHNTSTPKSLTVKQGQQSHVIRLQSYQSKKGNAKEVQYAGQLLEDKNGSNQNFSSQMVNQEQMHGQVYEIKAKAQSSRRNTKKFLTSSMPSKQKNKQKNFLEFSISSIQIKRKSTGQQSKSQNQIEGHQTFRHQKKESKYQVYGVIDSVQNKKKCKDHCDSNQKCRRCLQKKDLKYQDSSYLIKYDKKKRFNQLTNFNLQPQCNVDNVELDSKQNSTKNLQNRSLFDAQSIQGIDKSVVIPGRQTDGSFTNKVINQNLSATLYQNNLILPQSPNLISRSKQKSVNATTRQRPKTHNLYLRQNQQQQS